MRPPFRWGVSRLIYDFVASEPGGRGLSEIADFIYGDHEDGGPLAAEASIRVAISSMNKRLKLRDLAIVRDRFRSHNAPFRLRKISTGNIWVPIWRTAYD